MQHPSPRIQRDGIVMIDVELDGGRAVFVESDFLRPRDSGGSYFEFERAGEYGGRLPLFDRNC